MVKTIVYKKAPQIGTRGNRQYWAWVQEQVDAGTLKEKDLPHVTSSARKLWLEQVASSDEAFAARERRHQKTRHY